MKVCESFECCKLIVLLEKFSLAIANEGLQNLDLWWALKVFERRGRHPCRATSAVTRDLGFSVFILGPHHLVAFSNKQGILAAEDRHILIQIPAGLK
jgi:hypothetical protein